MTVVVSEGEQAPLRCQVGSGKASVSEPLLTCRKGVDDIETGDASSLRDEPGGCPPIGQVVSGMKAARARTAAPARNVGRRAMTRLPRVGWREGASRGGNLRD